MPNLYGGMPDKRQSEDVKAPVSRFRPTYRALTNEEKALHDRIKDKAVELEFLIEQTKAGREKALAMTALEESIMWAIKGLTA